MKGGGFSKARLARLKGALARGVEQGDMPGVVALIDRRGETHVQVLGPREDMVGILLTQRMMDSPQAPRTYVDFWNGAYQAIDD